MKQLTILIEFNTVISSTACHILKAISYFNRESAKW